MQEKNARVAYRARNKLMTRKVEYAKKPCPIREDSELWDDNIVYVDTRYLFYNDNEKLDPLKEGTKIFKVVHTWYGGVGTLEYSQEDDEIVVIVNYTTDPVRLIGENRLEAEVEDVRHRGGRWEMRIRWRVTRVLH